jgi:hypothetical protein
MAISMIARCSHVAYWAAALIVAASTSLACRTPPMANLTRLVEARRLAADAHVQFTKSVDAGNRAVMADTDEASAAFVGEAQKAADAVVADVQALRPPLQDLGYSAESAQLDEFNRRLSAFRALDKSILELSVENTNLKAQRLSFGPEQEAADAFRTALAAVAPPAQSPQAWHIQALSATALAAVREIQVLQAPHIAESDEAAMTRLERRAADAESTARHSLETLAPLLTADAHARLAPAVAALDRVVELNKQIVALSRRNSNVRSVALSLGQKRTLTAACEDTLQALQGALANRGFTGTR